MRLRGLRASLADAAGAVTTEMAIIMPFFMAGFLAFVIFAGRVAQAENDVRSAAHEAARAATLTGDASSAVSAARSVAAENLTASGVACVGGPSVVVDTGELVPGNYVTVIVTCTASFSDVALLGVPGSKTFTATAIEIIDQYRSS